MKNQFHLISLLLCCKVWAVELIDLNSNGISDIWENKYNATDLVSTESSKNADEDMDGATNAEEALAGTDPYDPRSVLRASEIENSEDTVSVTITSEVRKYYQLSSSPDLSSDSWSNIGSPTLATGEAFTHTIPNQTDTSLFYRLTAVDVDTDQDGLSDWTEEQLEGFDPNVNDSFNTGTANNDLNIARDQLTDLTNILSLQTLNTTAFEKEQTSASFTITRSDSTQFPLTLFLHRQGASDPTKGSATRSDYQLKTAGGTVIDRSITIPAGQSTVTIECTPNTDSKVEVPEELNLHIGGTSLVANLKICDAENTPENARLFIASLGPEGGAITSASGLSTVLVNGDNTIGSVNLSFFGLTAPQTAVHIHIKNPVSGPHLESLPMGQVTDHQWDIRAAHFLTTDQAVLDALYSGGLYINVHSSNYPSGEIRGDFFLADGNTTFTPPVSPPPLVSPTGDALDRDIARFLTQCTFGPTPELMTELKALVLSPSHNGDTISAYSAWLDTQLGLPSPNMEPYVHAADAQIRFLYSIPGSPSFRTDNQPRATNRRRAWWLLARHAPDQARQRLAFALSEIFVTSEKESTVDTRHYGHAHYYDMLKNQGTGSFRDLLESVSTHPIMAQYLSHLRNSKAILDNEGNVIVSPDENYAREIMQLFSIGLVQLHPDGSLKLDSQGLPIPTYAQDDISELSRVFTGWSFGEINSPSTSDTFVENMNFGYGNGSRYYQQQWKSRLKNFPDFHDTGAKNCPLLGLSIPAGGDGESDLDATIDFLANHSNTAPFISRRLIQRLVTSNPSAGYIYRIAQEWENTNGNLGAVYKAILLDPEARSLTTAELPGFGKKKEPIIHAVALMRAIDAKSRLPLADLAPSNLSVADLSTYAYSPTNFALFENEIAKFPAGTTRVRLSNMDSTLGQTPLAAPTVFNWFLPDYSIAGTLADAGLKVPEFQLATEISVVTNVNVHYSLTTNGNGLGASTLPNQAVDDELGDPHPTYNPYAYEDRDDHMITDFSHTTSAAAQAYLAVMDTNGDGLVSSLDTTFDVRNDIVNACAALVDHYDLLLCTGSLKANYGDGFTPDIVRADNPRDIIIKTVADYSTGRDDNDNPTDQASQIVNRMKFASYLVTSSPSAIIQK